ncbi:MAG: hypothetical protein KDE26_31340 [Bacteroidetes bacterium]|nr:hypothetical protein [Bacteroidota bacterium]
MELTFTVEKENCEFATGLITLGLLEGIKSGVIPAEAGIWSLGRPRFWTELERNQLISGSLLQVIKTSDELDVIERTGDLAKVLDSLITQVKKSLSEINYKKNSLIIDTVVKT